MNESLRRGRDKKNYDCLPQCWNANFFYFIGLDTRALAQNTTTVTSNLNEKVYYFLKIGIFWGEHLQNQLKIQIESFKLNTKYTFVVIYQRKLQALVETKQRFPNSWLAKRPPPTCTTYRNNVYPHPRFPLNSLHPRIVWPPAKKGKFFFGYNWLETLEMEGWWETWLNSRSLHPA